jgi:hypothetical protein
VVQVLVSTYFENLAEVPDEFIDKLRFANYCQVVYMSSKCSNEFAVRDLEVEGGVVFQIGEAETL